MIKLIYLINNLVGGCDIILDSEQCSEFFVKLSFFKKISILYDEDKYHSTFHSAFSF